MILGEGDVFAAGGDIQFGLRKTQPATLPGESHGQRSLDSYSLYGSAGSDTTEGTQHAHIDTPSHTY